MLFNPRWDLYSLVGLRDWLAKQPAGETYVWSTCKTCVVGQYLAAHGEDSWMYGTWIERTPGAQRAVFECFSDLAQEYGRSKATMGDALVRLDAWLVENATVPA